MKLPKIKLLKFKKNRYVVAIMLSLLNMVLALLALYILFRWG